MRLRFYLWATFALAACPFLWTRAGEAPARKPVIIAFSEDDFRQGKAHAEKEVALAPGDKLVVKLGSNPTTGYRWAEKPTNSSPEVLKQVKHDFQQNGRTGKNGEPMAGAGGSEVWTFEAGKAGQTALDFSYSRPWQGGDKGSWTLKVTAKVK